MGNNLEHCWTKMVEMAGEAKKTQAQITTMVVAERIDESGCVPPQRRINADYLLEQSEDQFRHSTQYQ